MGDGDPISLQVCFKIFHYEKVGFFFKGRAREFPDGPVVFILMGLGSIPGQGTKISKAMQHSQNKIKLIRNLKGRLNKVK